MAGLIAALQGPRNALLHAHHVRIAQWTMQTSRVAARTGTVHSSLVARAFTASVRVAQKSGNNPKEGGEPPMSPPPTALGTSKTAVDPNMVHDPTANIQSIEDLIRELNKDPSTAQTRPESEDDETKKNADNPDGQGEHQEDYQKKKKRDWSSWRQSRFWRYLWVVFYWSCLGSLPIHLMMIKNETKAVQEKLEWKIAVLQDMRDKLARGESIEDEEALLAVGMDRGKRELQHQVDDQMFEELIKSAEKLDMDVGRGFKVPIGEGEEVSDLQGSSGAGPTSAPAPAPSQPTTPRKPTPPKSEKSFL